MTMLLGWLAALMVADPNLSVSLSPDDHEAGGVVLEEEWEIHLQAKYDRGQIAERIDKMVIIARRRAYVVNERGHGLAHVDVYHSNRQALLRVNAEIQLPNGSIVPLGERAVRDADDTYDGDEGEVWRKKVLVFPRTTPGCVLVHEIIFERDGIDEVGRYFPPMAYPTRRFRITVRAHGKQRLAFATRGFERHRGQDEQHATWETHDLPALRQSSSFRIPREQIVPYLDFYDRNRSGGWNPIAKYYLDELAKRIDPDFINAAAGWELEPPDDAKTVSESDDDASIAAWFDYVRGLELRGRSRGVPTRTATEIIDSEQASYNERALVLYGALRTRGIPVGWLVMPGGNSFDLSAGYASHAGMNHLLVYVPRPDGDLVLDPSCDACAQGELAEEHEGRVGILIAGNDYLSGPCRQHFEPGCPVLQMPRTRMIRTPRTVLDQMAEVEQSVALTPDGLFVTHGAMTARGRLASRLEERLARYATSHEERAAMLRSYHLPDVAGGNLEILTRETADGPLVVLMTNGQLPTFAYTQTDNWLAIPLGTLNPRDWLFELASQRVPVSLRTSPGFRVRTHFAVPEGFTVAHVPEGGQLNSPAGSYRMQLTKEEGHIVAEEVLQFSRGIYAGADLSALKELLGAARNLRSQPLLLTRGSLR